MLAIRAGRLIDGAGGLLENVVVLVKGERISKVTNPRDAGILPDTEVIDATDLTIMPGMVDAHVHVRGDGEQEDFAAYKSGAVTESIGSLALKAFANARRNLMAGFTTIRDVGCFAYVDVALRDAIDSGRLEGPRMKVSGEALAATGGHLDRRNGLAAHVSTGPVTNLADSPDEGRKAARYQVAMGADLIKIAVTQSEHVRKRGGVYAPELTFDTIAAICEVGRQTGRKVAAHCHGGEGVRDAIEAGVYTLEHGRFISDELLEMMVERGVYLVPTLSPDGRVIERGQKEMGYDDAMWAWCQRSADAAYESVLRAHRMGVKVVAGSDAIMPFVRHGESAYELELLVRAGLTPMEAIIAATSIAAEALDMAEEIGTIEAGKFADFVIVDGDPLEDITILQDQKRIKRVIKGGVTVKARD
jgi:imidazolonepropionase-like amidohydrolase